ncbi:SEA/GATOR complex protein SEA3/WDR59, partial [Phenoliferia sp. Uapishka_3]
MSMSPANRDVALGARKGLFIVDLQNPYDPPRFLPHHSAWEVADVQWNPFPQRSEWVVSTSNQKAVVYNLALSPSLSVSPIEHTLHAHTRAVTDINWSPAAPEVLATCGLDGWVLSWDLRTGYGSRSGAGGGRKPVWGVSSWGSGATQVKWNRREPHIIASAHDNRVLIWDDRMGAAPVTTIDGHSAKIYGIDWSRQDSNKIVTCSLDKSFKSWSIKDTSSPDLTVLTSSPVWRARYTPFGSAVLTLPQRSDHALSIWGREKVIRSETAQPVARFQGATAGVKEFVWRTRGGQDMNNDDREFQLVTWAKDRRLRLWPITDDILKEVGHVKGGPITIPVTRRHSPDISYRTFAETPAAPHAPLAFPITPLPLLPRHLAPGTSSLLAAALPAASPAGPSLLTSSLLATGFAAAPSIIPTQPTTRDVLRGAATMTTSSVRNRRQRAHDRLAWMEGVKVLKPTPDLEQRYNGNKSTAGTETRPGETRSSSLQRGTDAGTAREGGETERAESVLAPGSKTTGTAVGKETVHVNLGEEITSVVRRFPRVNFEKVHVAGRTCTVSLYSPMFIRATFTFPKNYPHSSAPAIEIERNADIPLKSRAFLLQSIRKLMALRSQRGSPSFEQALRFLLGDRSDLEKPRPEEGSDDDDDDADEGLEGLTMGGGADILRNNLNVPPPRRGGAVFGPAGQLVVFFPTDAFATPNTERAHTPVATSLASKRRLPPRLSEAFGNLFGHEREVTDDEKYQETDEALQMSSGLSFQVSAIHKPVPVIASAPHVPSFSTAVHVKDFSHLTMLNPNRTPTSLAGPPLAVAREALSSAIAARDPLLVSIWTTLVCFCDHGGPASGERPIEKGLAQNLLPELMNYLEHLRDIQTLGVIACVLESYRRTIFENANLPVAAPTSPLIDYFSHRTTSGSSSSGTPYDARTPLASGYRAARPTYSPKTSWTNLAGLFNSSVLSLRTQSYGSPTGGSPESVDSSATKSPVFRSPSRDTSPESKRLRPPLSRQHSKLRDDTSPTVTFGSSVSVISGKSSTGPAAPVRLASGPGSRRVVISQSCAPPTPPHLIFWWASASAQIELELLRLAYAELLARWQNDNLRLDVLKLCCSSAAAPNFGSFGAATVRAGNGYDRVAVIGTSSRALTSTVSLIAYVFLRDHSRLSFLCVSSGGTSGIFVAQAPATTLPKESPRQSAWLRSSLPFFA